jgi:hypothetical protein
VLSNESQAILTTQVLPENHPSGRWSDLWVIESR